MQGQVRSLLRTAALLALAFGCAAPAHAQAGVGRGRVAERVRASGDTTISYALYLPSGWTAARRWPVLVLLDPAANAMTAMRHFRAAAERRGWIVMASYDAKNGGGPILQRDEQAVRAILDDARRRWSADTSRVYLGGLSGMARFAWALAAGRDGRIGGLLGASAGFPRDAAEWLPVIRGIRPFPYFGTAGTADFNREEVEAVDSLLDATALPHRMALFDGDHGWPPADVAARALDWMQLQAIRSGAVPRDPRFVDSLYAAGLAHARGLETSSPVDAWREYRGLAADFAGLRDVSPASARAAALARSPALQRQRSRRAVLAARVRQYPGDVYAVLGTLAGSPDGGVPSATLATLRIDALRAEQRDSLRDRDAAQAATRMLTTLSVAAGGAGSQLIRAGRYAQAAAALRLALRAKLNDAPVCYNLARATAELGRSAEAFDALRCAVAGRAATKNDLQSEPLLAPLRADPRFAALVRAASTTHATPP